MLRALLLITLLVALATTPALADTGGLTAQTPPAVSPQGGVRGPAAIAPPEATHAREEKAPGDPAPVTTTPQAPARQSQSGSDEPLDPSPATERATSGSASSGGGSTGGGLPHTGFAVAALVAIGTGFFLTGYALRYSRALDG